MAKIVKFFDETLSFLDRKKKFAFDQETEDKQVDLMVKRLANAASISVGESNSLAALVDKCCCTSTNTEKLHKEILAATDRAKVPRGRPRKRGKRRRGRRCWRGARRR